MAGTLLSTAIAVMLCWVNTFEVNQMLMHEAIFCVQQGMPVFGQYIYDFIVLLQNVVLFNFWGTSPEQVSIGSFG